MIVSILISRYRQAIQVVETQSCDHGPMGTRLTGEKWKFCCGISYEYFNDILVRSAIDAAVGVGKLSPDELQLVEELDARLKALLAANGVSTEGPAFWENGLPIGVAE